jgi:hypothetical protein
MFYLSRHSLKPYEMKYRPALAVLHIVAKFPSWKRANVKAYCAGGNPILLNGH